MNIVYYLQKAEKFAINSGKEVRYFKVAIDVKPHTHPLYIGRCIEEKLAELGLKQEGYYCNTIAIWSGDIDEKIAEAERIAGSYEHLKKEFPVQFYGNLKTAEDLRAAKNIMAENNIS